MISPAGNMEMCNFSVHTLPPFTELLPAAVLMPGISGMRPAAQINAYLLRECGRLASEMRGHRSGNPFHDSHDRALRHSPRQSVDPCLGVESRSRPGQRNAKLWASEQFHNQQGDARVRARTGADGGGARGRQRGAGRGGLRSAGRLRHLPHRVPPAGPAAGGWDGRPRGNEGVLLLWRLEGMHLIHLQSLQRGRHSVRASYMQYTFSKQAQVSSIRLAKDRETHAAPGGRAPLSGACSRALSRGGQGRARAGAGGVSAGV